jgi:hypothetical protein
MALFVLGAAVAADQVWTYGYYTDATLEVLKSAVRSVGKPAAKLC